MLEQVRGWLEGGAKLFDRRRAPRIETPPECFVVIDGRQYGLRNWSSSGLLVSPYDGDLKENRGFAVRIAIRQEPYNFVIDARAIVVRRDAGGLAARFITMSAQHRQLLDDYFNTYALWVKVNR